MHISTLYPLLSYCSCSPSAYPVLLLMLPYLLLMLSYCLCCPIANAAILLRLYSSAYWQGLSMVCSVAGLCLHVIEHPANDARAAVTLQVKCMGRDMYNVSKVFEPWVSCIRALVQILHMHRKTAVCCSQETNTLSRMLTEVCTYKCQSGVTWQLQSM